MTKLKKFSFSAIALTAILSTTVLTTACSGVSNSIIKSLVNAGEYNLYTENVSVKDVLNLLPSNNDAVNKFKHRVAQQLVYNWYIGDTKNDDEEKPTKSLKNNKGDRVEKLDDWNDEINSDYKSKVKSYKNEHKGDWPYYFQNEVLSPVGGYEENYKFQALLDKIYDNFADSIFETSYLGFALNGDDSQMYNNHALSQVNKNGTYVTADGTVSQTSLWDDPDQWGNIGFYESIDANYPKKESNAKFNALVQKFVFDEWFNATLPFISYAYLFKSSEPTEGYTSIYNIKDSDIPTKTEENPDDGSSDASSGDDANGDGSDSSDGDNTTTVTDETAATKVFPYFQHDPDFMNAASAQEKFYELIKLIFSAVNPGASNNYTAANDKLIDTKIANTAMSTTHGGFFSGSYVNLTDDSSVFLTMNGNGSNYTSFVAPYSINAYSQYNSLFGSTNEVKNNYSTFSVANNESESDILSYFLLPENGSGTNIPANTFTSYIDLFNVYGNYTGNDGNGSKIFNKDGKYNDEKYRFAINSFGIQNSPYIFVLNEFGVHCIAVDGFDYIKNGYTGDNDTSLEARLNRQKNAYMLRAFMEASGYWKTNSNNSGDDNNDNKSSSIDINSQIKTYFNDNKDDLIIKMASDAELMAAFTDKDTNTIDWLNDTDKTFLVNLMNYQQNVNYYSKYQDSRNQLNNYWDSYISVYGDVNKVKNGIIAPFAFTYDANNSVYAVVKDTFNNYYNHINKTSSSDITTFNQVTKYNELLTSYADFINLHFVDGDNVVMNKTKSGMFRWQQTLLITDKSDATKNIKDSLWSVSMAQALDTLTNNGFLGNIEKYHAIYSYLYNDGNGIIKSDETSIDFTSNGLNTANAALNEVINSEYYSTKVTNSKESIVKNNASVNSFDSYYDAIKTQYDNSLTQNSLKGILPYEEDNINYYTFLSTLAYLIYGDKDGNIDINVSADKKFINLLDHIRDIIGGSQAFIGFVSQDAASENLNSKFDKESAKPTYTDGDNGSWTTVDNQYVWRSNYLNKFNSIYAPKNSLSVTNQSNDYSRIGEGFVAYDKYWSTAELAGQTFNGYTGLLTNGSTNGVPEYVSNYLFKSLIYNSYSGGYGALYEYGSYDGLVSRIQSIYDDTTLDKFIDSLNTKTGQQYQSYFNQLKIKVDGEGHAIPISTRKETLINVMDEINRGSNGIYFKLPSNDITSLPNKYDMIVDEQGHSAGVVTDPSNARQKARYIFVQINENDLVNTEGELDPTALVELLGEDILYRIAIQYASDSDLQSDVITIIRNKFYTSEAHPGKVQVFDKRANDQLGKKWVYDFKEIE